MNFCVNFLLKKRKMFTRDEKRDFFLREFLLRLFLIQGWEMVKKKACHVPFFFCQNCFLSSLLGTKRIKMENEVEKFEK